MNANNKDQSGEKSGMPENIQLNDIELEFCEALNELDIIEMNRPSPWALMVELGMIIPKTDEL